MKVKWCFIPKKYFLKADQRSVFSKQYMGIKLGHGALKIDFYNLGHFHCSILLSPFPRLVYCTLPGDQPLPCLEIFFLIPPPFLTPLFVLFTSVFCCFNSINSHNSEIGPIHYILLLQWSLVCICIYRMKMEQSAITTLNFLCFTNQILINCTEIARWHISNCYSYPQCTAITCSNHIHIYWNTPDISVALVQLSK